MNTFSLRIIHAIRQVVGQQQANLHEPTFSGNELKYLQECINSSFVSSAGKFVDRFESELAAYTRADYAVAVVNGTAALHVALLLAGVKPKDEVLIPSLTFVATANAIRYAGAEPHFVDCEQHTLGVDPEALRHYLSTVIEIRHGQSVNRRTGSVVRALVPVHVFGHPCDIDGLLSVARDFHLMVVEDAAESLGSYYKEKHTGTLGLIGIVSFNGNKTITTGGGGAILTSNPELAYRAKHLCTTAKVPHSWEYSHDKVGFNYRMPSLNAALGCAQLEQLPQFLESKRRLFERYRDAFKDFQAVQVMEEPVDCRSNYWLQALLLDKSAEDERDNLLEDTNNAGLMTRPIWTLLHRLAPYQDCPRAPLPVAESLELRILNLPSSAGLS